MKILSLIVLLASVSLAQDSTKVYLQTRSGGPLIAVPKAWVTGEDFQPQATATVDSTIFVTKTNLDSVKANRATVGSLTAKQAALVSGTNIKTINGSSVLGSGDLVVSGSSGVLRVPFSVPVLAATVWTNMPAAASFFLSTATVAKSATGIDLTNYTQCRLLVNKQGTSGASASKLILRYKASPFTQTVANYIDIGTSEVSVAINVNNTFLATAWKTLAEGAKADVYVDIIGSGGDGVLDPAFGSVVVEFK